MTEITGDGKRMNRMAPSAGMASLDVFSHG